MADRKSKILGKFVRIRICTGALTGIEIFLAGGGGAGHASGEDVEPHVLEVVIVGVRVANRGVQTTGVLGLNGALLQVAHGFTGRLQADLRALSVAREWSEKC